MVSILRTVDPPTSPSTPHDPHHVVLHGLGARSSQTSQEGTRGLYALACRRRQVYKVDKGSINLDLCDQVRASLLFFLDIVHRFGVPNSIITGNDTQFTKKKFLRFYDEYRIRVDWAALVHPRTNGQVERANDMVLHGLRPRIVTPLVLRACLAPRFRPKRIYRNDFLDFKI